MSENSGDFFGAAVVASQVIGDLRLARHDISKKNNSGVDSPGDFIHRQQEQRTGRAECEQGELEDHLAL